MPRYKLTTEQVDKMRSLFLEGHSTEFLSKMFGVSTTMVYYIITNEKRVDPSYTPPKYEQVGIFPNMVKRTF